MSWRRQLTTAHELAEASPAYGPALRAATATVLPLLAGELTGHLELVWMALGGWLASFADPGGAYPARALSIGSVALTGALAFSLGMIGGQHPWAAPLLLLLGAVACSVVRVYGDTAATAGVLVLVAYCIGIGTPSAQPLERGLLMGAGGALSLLLALGLWPIHPYAPAREAVADCYRGLAELSRALALGDPTIPLRKRVREALEKARATLAAARSTRMGETGRGEQLLVLFELAEHLLGDLVALAELPPDDALEGLSAAFEAVAQAVPRASAAGPLRAPAIELVTARPADARVVRRTRLALETAAQLGGARATRPLDRGERPRLLDALAPGSLQMRHALRLGVTLAIAQAIANLLQLSRSHWITVSIVIILQPYAGATVRRTLQRVGGTALGAVVAALLAAAIHSQLLIGVLLFPLSMAAVAARPLNYGLYSVLMTPVFVLLAESTGGDWHLAPLRIANNLIGGVLAFAASRLFWPNWERERLPAQLAQLLRSDGAFAREALTAGAALAAVRRHAGLAAANAETSLQRFLDEPHDPARVEPLMALLAYSRRFTAAVAAFAAEGVAPAPQHARAVEAALEELAQAVAQGRKPAALPPLDLAALDARQAGHLEALERPLRVMASALGHLAG